MSGIDRPNQADSREPAGAPVFRPPPWRAGSRDAKLLAILASLRHALAISAAKSGETASPRNAARPAAAGAPGAVTRNPTGLASIF